MSKEKPTLYKLLKAVLKYPIVILMVGDWRTGKTDTSLLVGHVAKRWGLIDAIGANIWTFNNPEVEYIITMGKLKKWLHADKKTKLFIFDEGLAHIPRRTAMSHKNIAMLKLLAELSKGHGRMIICSQITKLDSDVLNPAFVRAFWVKKSKKVMECRGKHYPRVTFTGLPRSPIRFDPDRLAPFIDTDLSKAVNKEGMGLTHEIAGLYSKGHSMSQIKRAKGIHQETVKREVRKALKWFVENYELPEEENVNK